MSSDSVPTIDHRHNPGLAAILAADGGPSIRQVDHWVRTGHLRPDITTEGRGRNAWTWPAAEQRVAVAMARLVAAGLDLAAAESVTDRPFSGIFVGTAADRMDAEYLVAQWIAGTNTTPKRERIGAPGGSVNARPPDLTPMSEIGAQL